MDGRRRSSPGTYLRYSANSTLDPSVSEEVYGTMLAVFMQGLGAVAQAGVATG